MAETFGETKRKHDANLASVSARRKQDEDDRWELIERLSAERDKALEQVEKLLEAIERFGEDSAERIEAIFDGKLRAARTQPQSERILHEAAYRIRSEQDKGLKEPGSGTRAEGS